MLVIINNQLVNFNFYTHEQRMLSINIPHVYTHRDYINVDTFNDFDIIVYYDGTNICETDGITTKIIVADLDKSNLSRIVNIANCLILIFVDEIRMYEDSVLRASFDLLLCDDFNIFCSEELDVAYINNGIIRIIRDYTIVIERPMPLYDYIIKTGIDECIRFVHYIHDNKLCVLNVTTGKETHLCNSLPFIKNGSVKYFTSTCRCLCTGKSAYNYYFATHNIRNITTNGIDFIIHTSDNKATFVWAGSIPISLSSSECVIPNLAESVLPSSGIKTSFIPTKNARF